MNILEALVQLRDDLKTWVSLNFEALNKKIDKKSQARFSRDYHDLYNAPQITDDNKKELSIADEAGNIIFKLDEKGAHTTNLTLQDKKAATEEYVDQAIENINFSEIDLTGYATEQYVDKKVADLVDSAPEALNTLGELAEAMSVHEDAYDALLETVGQKATREEIKDLEEALNNGVESEAEEYCIADKDGNMIFKVDKDGVETTAVKTKALAVDGKDLTTHIQDAIDAIEFLETDLSNYPTKGEVEQAIADIEFPVTDLTGYATEEFVGKAIEAIDFPEPDLSEYATEEYVKNKIAEAKLEGEDIDLSGYATKSDLNGFIKEIPAEYINEQKMGEIIEQTKRDLGESISSGAGEFQIADEEGNVIVRVNKDGVHTTNLTFGGGVAATQEFVENAINNINIPEVDFTGYATEDYVDQAIKDIDIPKVDLTGYATEDYVDQAIKNIDISEVDLTNYVTKDEVTDFVKEDKLDEELAKLQKSFNEGISSEAEDLQISDDEGNVIVRIDAGGIHTTALTLHEKPVATEEFVEAAIESIDISNVDLAGYATEDYVKQEIATLVNSAPETLNTLGELATAIEDNGDAISALEKIAEGKASQIDLNKTNQEVTAVKNLVGTSSVQSQINKALDNLDVVFSGDYRDLINAPNINEDESGDMVVTDDAGYVAFKVDSNGGTHVTSLSINGTMLDSILASKVERNEITLTGLGLTYGKQDLTPGTSELPTGHFYFVYE